MKTKSISDKIAEALCMGIAIIMFGTIAEICIEALVKILGDLPVGIVGGILLGAIATHLYHKRTTKRILAFYVGLGIVISVELLFNIKFIS